MVRSGRSWLVLSLFVGVVLSMVGCALFRGKKTEPIANQDALENDADELEDQASATEEGIDPDASDTPPHPKVATQWAVQTLLLEHSQPPVDAVRNCYAEVAANANEAGTDAALLSAKSTVSVNVRQNVTLYHWCFYQMLRDLDVLLGRTGLTFRDKGRVFLDKMKSLWILAHALDESGGQSIYFDFLRNRYVQMSNEYFGRNVIILAPPLTDKTTGSSAVRGDGADGIPTLHKPAGEANVE